MWNLISDKSIFNNERRKGGYHISGGSLVSGKIVATKDLSGCIKQVYVYINDTILGLKFMFAENGTVKEGSLHGTKENCRLHLVHVPDNSYISGITTDISEGKLSIIQFHYANNESSDIIGNPNNVKHENIATIHNDNYRLVNAKVASSWKYRNGIEAIQFQFAHINSDLQGGSELSLAVHG
ncbi:hypothetical protein ACTHOQ_06295 [Solibacillus silvestris]|uniref:hypothetical protein n=1 Tax=Solibacillus silvestris TaxID=76853 RepID=UPI003F81BA74